MNEEDYKNQTMKNKTALTLIGAIAVCAASAFGQGYHHNNGYIDSSGVFHPGHYQTNPDNNSWDNWSTRGNYNPFTGLSGTQTPQGPRYDRNGVYHPY
jgi:hypothetical protein